MVRDGVIEGTGIKSSAKVAAAAAGAAVTVAQGGVAIHKVGGIAPHIAARNRVVELLVDGNPNNDDPSSDPLYRAQMKFHNGGNVNDLTGEDLQAIQARDPNIGRAP